MKLQVVCVIISGCPPEFVAKMSGAGIPLQLSIKRNGSGGWEWTARLGQMSAHTSVVEGQDHSIGAHAPQRFLFQQSSKVCVCVCVCVCVPFACVQVNV